MLVAGPLIFFGAWKIFTCSMWDLVPWPGIKPWPPALGTWSLDHQGSPSQLLAEWIANRGFFPRLHRMPHLCPSLCSSLACSLPAFRSLLNVTLDFLTTLAKTLPWVLTSLPALSFGLSLLGILCILCIAITSNNKSRVYGAGSLVAFIFSSAPVPST